MSADWKLPKQMKTWPGACMPPLSPGGNQSARNAPYFSSRELLEPISLTPLPDTIQQGVGSCTPRHCPGPHLQEQRLVKPLAAGQSPFLQGHEKFGMRVDISMGTLCGYPTEEFQKCSSLKKVFGSSLPVPWLLPLQEVGLLGKCSLPESQLHQEESDQSNRASPRKDAHGCAGAATQLGRDVGNVAGPWDPTWLPGTATTEASSLRMAAPGPLPITVYAQGSAGGFFMPRMRWDGRCQAGRYG